MVRRHRRLHYLLLLLLLVAFHNEFLSYYLVTWTWPGLPSGDSKSVRLLLVADPQMLGEADEPWGVIGWLTRRDADNYLAMTFSQAFSHVKPDVVVFLGDLLDEGSKATPEEMVRYKRRFNTVFQMDSDAVLIGVPGDNDVGGEGSDWFTAEKVHKFQNYFVSGPDITGLQLLGGHETYFKSFRFFWLDRLFIPLGPGREAAEINDTAAYRVLFTHMPLTPAFSHAMDREFLRMRPHVIFSAHTHSSFHVYRHFLLPPVGHPEPDWWEPVQDKHFLEHRPYRYEFNLEEIKGHWVGSHEFIVPTCSYRMGVPNMAYGAALITGDGHGTYALLWLPSRFAQFAAYAVVAAFLLLYIAGPCCCYVTCNCCKKVAKMMHLI